MPGDTSTEATVCITVTTADPDASPALAVIVAVPFAAAVTRPEPSTAATASSLDSHENSAPATARPFASNASAASRRVSPRAPMVASAGNTPTESGDCITVTTAAPEAPPALAVIVAVPLPAAVTRPVGSTCRHVGAAARPGYRRARHDLAVLVAHFGPELHGCPKGREFGGRGGDRDRGGPWRIGRWRLRGAVSAAREPRSSPPSPRQPARRSYGNSSQYPCSTAFPPRPPKQARERRRQVVVIDELLALGIQFNYSLIVLLSAMATLHCVNAVFALCQKARIRTPMYCLLCACAHSETPSWDRGGRGG